MSRLLAAIGALSLLAGGFITYINTEVLDPDAAGERAADALGEDPDLRAAIAAQISDSVPDLPIIGGLDTDSAEAALSNSAAVSAFGQAVSITVEDLNSDQRPEPLELNLAQVAIEATTGLSSTPLDLATDQIDSLQIDLSKVERLLDLLDLVGELEPIGPPLLIVGALLMLASVLLAAGLTEGLIAAGLAVGLASCLGVVILIVGRMALGAGFDEQVTRDAVLAVWGALGSSLMTVFIVAGAVGFVIAAGAWLASRSPRRLEPVPPGPPSRRATTVIRPGRQPPPPPPQR